MAGHRSIRHHLDALRDVLDAASSDVHDLALPWPVLATLRSLLRSDVVAFRGLDHEHARSSFVQVSTSDVQAYADQTDPMAVARALRLLHPSPCSSARLRVGIPDGHGRELQLVALRHGGRGYDECDRVDLRLLLPHLEAVYRRGEELRVSRAVTARQAMLMELVRDGYTNAQVARRLDLAEGTVRTHLNNIYARLGVRSRTEAVRRLYGNRGPALAAVDLRPR